MIYSLHIGLNRVSPAAYGGWDGKLSGCHNDADAMAAIAVAKGARAYILLSQDATIEKVVDAIWALGVESIAGDTVIITYSGHGGQYPDHSGDEADGMDETWCLYNGMLLDDDLNRMLADFDKGVKVVVVSDSCHSGTVTKRLAMAGMHTLSSMPVKCAPLSACLKAPMSSTPAQEARGKKPRMKASIVLLGGCQDNQFSYDGGTNGLFTEKLLQVFEQGHAITGYRAFRKAIGQLMPPEQTPSLYIIGGKNKAFENGPVFT
jgi:hypothetical protein